MAVSRKNIKGVANIRTHSGSVDRTLKPHEAHMRLCVLEMEKARRGQERESAMRRVRVIDERYKEIEEEKKDILEALELHDRGPSRAVSNRPARQKPGSCDQETGSFRLKY